MRNPKKQIRGFAAMSLEKRSEIARKGGLAVSQDKDHMKNLGSRGGKAMHRRYKVVLRKIQTPRKKAA